MAIGTYTQIVSLDETDGAGGVRPLDPPTWYCAPIAEGGGLLTLVGHYHAGLTTASRVHLKGRTFHVDGVLDRGGRGFQTQITCQEVFDASSDTPALPAYHDLVVADGASHYWRLGETTGPTAVDLVGGANGAISGGVTLNQPGAITDGNPAMAFNGTTGKIVTPMPVTLNAPYTWEVWFQTTAVGAERPLLANGWGAAVDRVIVLLSASSDLYLYCSLNGNAFGTSSTGVPLHDGSWHHVVATIQPAHLELFVDGVSALVYTDSINFTSGTAPLEIGYASAWPSFYLGTLDEVAIYPHALTAAQILAHYTAGTT